MRLAGIALLALCATAWADLESRYHDAQVAIWGAGGTNAFSRHSNLGLAWATAEKVYRADGLTLYSVRLYEHVARGLSNAATRAAAVAE